MKKNTRGVPGMLCRWACIAATLIMTQPLFAETSTQNAAKESRAEQKTILVNSADWFHGHDHSGSTSSVRLWTPEMNVYETRYTAKSGLGGLARSSRGEVAFSEAMDVEPRKASLIVLNSKGETKEVAQAGRIREFHWSPDGTKIAYDKWETSQNNPGTVSAETETMVICDLTTGKTTAVPIESSTSFCWAAFDGMLYIQTQTKDFSGVLRYDPVSEKIEKTGYQSIMFSPDGKYYFEEPAGLPSPLLLRIRIRATNAVLNETSDSPIPYLAGLRLRPIIWLDNTHLVTRDCGGNEYQDTGAWYIMDVTNGVVRKPENRPVAPYQPDKVVVIKINGGDLALETISTLPVVKPEDLPVQWYPEFDARKQESPEAKASETDLSGENTKTFLVPRDVYCTEPARSWKAIRTWNPKTGLYKALFRCKNGDGLPFNPKRSQKGTVAFLSATETGGNESRQESLQLLMRTGATKELARDRSLRDFEWSPNGNAIAYTTFDEIKEGCSLPREVTIVNIATGKSKKIPAKGDLIYWAKFDGMLYIRVDEREFKGVLRYDPTTGALERTQYQSVKFSPDGKYYFRAPYYEEDPFPLTIHIRETNAVLNEGDRSPIPYLASLRLEAWFWLDNRLVAATVPSSGTTGPWYVLDVGTGQIRKTENELLELWKPDKVVVKKKDGSGLALETISEMPIIKPEDLPPSWFKDLEAKYSGK